MTERPARVSAQTVAQLYSDYRTKYSTDYLTIGAGAHSRSLKKKSAEIAVFAAENNDGRTWGDVMHDWNKKDQENRYSDVRLFTRDCRKAYARVTGAKLRWKRKRGAAGHKRKGR